VSDLRSGDKVRGASLVVRRGEIVGVYGLVGAGRSELAQAIFGLRSRQGGEIEVDGHRLPAGHTPRQAMREGVAFLPEDRTEDGLFSDRSLAENLCAPRLEAYGTALLSESRMRADTDAFIDRLAIKGASDTIVKNLSGGNQQKALFGRWLATTPRLLIVDEPTRGVDVGTKALLHRELENAAASGQGVLMISSELPEILRMSDRIYVMAAGRITDEMPAAEATEERILRSGSPA
jgi:ABC-type sugar transport system ATPase subunit